MLSIVGGFCTHLLTADGSQGAISLIGYQQHLLILILQR